MKSENKLLSPLFGKSGKIHVRSVKLLFVSFILQHNSLLVDHAGNLFRFGPCCKFILWIRTIFPDFRIAQKHSCTRTKIFRNML